MGGSGWPSRADGHLSLMKISAIPVVAESRSLEKEDGSLCIFREGEAYAECGDM